MNKGLYTASVAMTTQMNKMEVVSNNIANANTTGFKKDGVVTRSFDEELFSRINDQTPLDIIGVNKSVGKLNLGLNVDLIYTDFSTGSFQRTDNKTDLAIAGDGFFSVNYVNNDGTIVEKYTRDGSFTLGPNGELLTSDKFAVLDENGTPIVIPKDSVPSISEDGTIYDGANFVAKLKLTSFSNNDYLKKFGSNYYDIGEGAEIIPFTGSINQGFVEGSNVNSVKEMVDMITLSRAYEASSKMIQAHDTIMGKTANDVGRK